MKYSDRGFTIIEVAVVLCVAGIVAAVGYVWWQGRDTALVSTKQSSDSAQASPTPVPLPEGWALAQSHICAVSIPVPPKRAPYLGTGTWAGSYWKFYEDPDLGIDPSITSTFQLTPASANVLFAPHEKATSGQTSVTVYCSLVGAGHDSTPQFVAAWKDVYEQQLKQELGDDVSAIKEAGIQSQASVTMWGIQTVKIVVPNRVLGEGETDYYLFAKDHRDYVVAPYKLPVDDQINAVVQPTLDGLVF